MTIDQAVTNVVVEKVRALGVTPGQQRQLRGRLNRFVDADRDAATIWLTPHSELGVLVSAAEPPHSIGWVLRLEWQDMRAFVADRIADWQQQQQEA